MKQKFSLTIALFFLTSMSLAGQGRSRLGGNPGIPALERGRTGIGLLGSPFSFFGGDFFRGGGRIGIFGSSRGHHFAGHRGRSFFGSSSWTPWVSALYAWNAREEVSSSDRFVEEWKDRETFPEEAWLDLSASPLLSEGMTAEEVALAVGTPLQRSQLGAKQVWKYSSFSLLLQNGRLKGVR